MHRLHNAHHAPGARAGFTLTELLVAMPILLLLLTLAAVAINQAQITVSEGTANLDVLAHVQTLQRRMEDDFRRLSKEGFLVIRTQNVAVANYPDPGTTTNHEADQLLFFAMGPWFSQQFTSTGVQRDFQAPIARVWYGHLADQTLDDPTTPAVNEATWANTRAFQLPHVWMLGRQALLITPAPTTGMHAAARLWDHQDYVATEGPFAGADLINGTADIVKTTMMEIAADVTASTDPEVRMAQACFVGRTRGLSGFRVGTALGAGTIRDDYLRTTNVIAGACSKFKVEYWDGAKWERPDPDDPPNPPYYVVGYGWGTWPRSLRITVELHDPRGVLHDSYLDARDGAVTNGREYQFVVSLPAD